MYCRMMDSIIFIVELLGLITNVTIFGKKKLFVDH